MTTRRELREREAREAREAAARAGARPVDTARPAETAASADLRGFHLLLLDDGLEVSDILALVHNRLPDVPAHLDEHGQVRLSRHSRLSGAVDIDAETIAALEVPDWAHRVIALDCPRDREPAPPPDWFADTDGLDQAFPDGMPDREEERALSLLISIASRLHTGVRLGDESGMGTRVLVPEPEAKVDLYVYSQYWLDPDVALSVVRRAAPHAFRQVAAEPDAAVLAQATLDDPTFDASAPVILDGYSIIVPLGEIDESAGALEIRVTEAEWVPPIVGAYTDQPQIEYHIHWKDARENRYRPNPTRRFRRMRRRVGHLVDEIGAELIIRSDGIGLDENGFLVTSTQLRN